MITWEDRSVRIYDIGLFCSFKNFGVAWNYSRTTVSYFATQIQGATLLSKSEFVGQKLIQSHALIVLHWWPSACEDNIRQITLCPSFRSHSHALTFSRFWLVHLAAQTDGEPGGRTRACPLRFFFCRRREPPAAFVINARASVPLSARTERHCKLAAECVSAAPVAFASTRGCSTKSRNGLRKGVIPSHWQYTCVLTYIYRRVINDDAKCYRCMISRRPRCDCSCLRLHCLHAHQSPISSFPAASWVWKQEDYGGGRWATVGQNGPCLRTVLHNASASQIHSVMSTQFEETLEKSYLMNVRSR